MATTTASTAFLLTGEYLLIPLFVSILAFSWVIGIAIKSMKSKDLVS